MTKIATAAKIAHTLDAFDAETGAAIRAQASESADLCLDNGWDPSGDAYDLAAMPGDEQALSDRLGHKATREEARAMELCIRLHIEEERDELARGVALDAHEATLVEGAHVEVVQRPGGSQRFAGETGTIDARRDSQFSVRLDSLGMDVSFEAWDLRVIGGAS